MSEPRILTLVFHVNDMDAFERDHPGLKEMALGKFDAPYTLASMSCANEVRRSGLIRDVLDTAEDQHWYGADTVEEIDRIMNLFEPEEFDAYEAEMKEREEQDAADADETCDACGNPTGEEIVGCPDGREICTECFEQGEG